MARLRLPTSDFDSISLHDVPIHAIAAMPDTFELALDIDYVIAAECSHPGATMQLTLVPAVMKFFNVSDVSINLRSGQGLVTIASASRKRDALGEQWEIECDGGHIAFRASGFTIDPRRAEVSSSVPRVDFATRGLPFSNE